MDLEGVRVKRANVQTTSCNARDVKTEINDMKRPTLKPPVTVDLPAPQYNQDEWGRLKNSTMFPDSKPPLTLENYKEYAASLKTRISQKIPEILKYYDGEATFRRELDEEFIKRVNLLEWQFWSAMTDGIYDTPLTVAYGIHVEAGGDFHIEGQSYVERYGTAADGRVIKRNQFEKIKPLSVIPYLLNICFLIEYSSVSCCYIRRITIRQGW